MENSEQIDVNPMILKAMISQMASCAREQDAEEEADLVRTLLTLEYGPGSGGGNGPQRAG